MSSDFKEMVDAAFHLDDSEEIPRHISAAGVKLIKPGTKYNPFTSTMKSFSDFTRLVDTMISEQDEGDRCIVYVDRTQAQAILRWPTFADQSITLQRELTEEAKAWLQTIEHIDNPKALAEFIEDYGEWLKAPDDVNQPNRLDLVQALTSIRITNRTDGSIEFRPHGDKAEFSVARNASSKAMSVELPVELYAAPQLHVGDNTAYQIKVRVNYSVDDNNRVHVRCRVANRDALFLRATEDLARRLRSAFEGNETCMVVM